MLNRRKDVGPTLYKYYTNVLCFPGQASILGHLPSHLFREVNNTFKIIFSKGHIIIFIIKFENDDLPE